MHADVTTNANAYTSHCMHARAVWTKLITDTVMRLMMMMTIITIITIIVIVVIVIITTTTV